MSYHSDSYRRDRSHSRERDRGTYGSYERNPSGNDSYYGNSHYQSYSSYKSYDRDDSYRNDSYRTDSKYDSYRNDSHYDSYRNDSRYQSKYDSYRNDSARRDSRYDSYRTEKKGGNLQELDPIEYDIANLPEIKKNFYVESEISQKRNPAETQAYLDHNEISVQNCNDIKVMMSFEETNFPESIMQVIKKQKYEKPTPIQAVGWPIVLQGNDVVGIAETGSGKTISFMIPFDVRKLFGLKSTIFEVKVLEDNVEFSVIGYGHGVGMSQTGANELAKNGNNYEQILHHYYTNVDITNME